MDLERLVRCFMTNGIVICCYMKFIKRVWKNSYCSYFFYEDFIKRNTSHLLIY